MWVVYELVREGGDRRRSYCPRCSTLDAREDYGLETGFGVPADPWPAWSNTLRYGGNTSCVEVWGNDGKLIVLDCGTGAHGLGQALLSAGPRVRCALTCPQTKQRDG